MGRSLLRQLVAKEMELRRKYDIRWRLAGVATRRFGWIADPEGLNPIAALSGHFATGSSSARNVREWLERAKAEGDLPAGVDAAELAGYVITVLQGMSVQAAGGASREKLRRIAERAMVAWPEAHRGVDAGAGLVI